MKKMEPNTESLIVKVVSIYSIPWILVKYIPNSKVANKAVFVWKFLPSRRLACAQVTVSPEASKIKVFKRGAPLKFKEVTPTGGQRLPNSSLTARLAWKKAQKKEKKNMISEIINNTIPLFKPRRTFALCVPWRTLSRLTSRHQ